MIAPPARGNPLLKLVILSVPSAVVFSIAYDNGGYALASRSFWAIAVWWAVILLAASGTLRGGAVGTPALLVVGLLSAVALLTLVSALWGSSAERALNEFNRVSLYLGVLALVLLASSRISRARFCDSLAVGICGVVLVALISRFASGAFSDRGIADVLPSAATRLSFPLGYWNGLAILAALAVPLLLRAASSAGPPALRAAAVVPLPAIAVVTYLASSRGGYFTALIGATAFLLLSRERWWAATAIAAGGIGSALAVAGVADQTAFVNRPETALGGDQASTALLYVILGCAIAGGAFAVLLALLRGKPRPSHSAGVATVWVAVGTAVVALLVVDLPARFRAFRRPPDEAVAPTDDFVRSHLLSANGSGRWQFWESALDAFQSKPLLGHGAGSYEAWWAEHGTLALFIRDAHSLYLEVLAELGIVGFLLLVAAFSVGVATALIRLRELPTARAGDLAAPTAAFLAFVGAAAIDWMWELTVVSVVAFACLALMIGGPPSTRGFARSFSLRPAIVGSGLVAAWFLICLQAVPYLSELRIRASQEAAARGDGTAALDAAESARAISPWAASPWLQVALVQEELGDLQAAERAISRARDNDSADWRLWLVSARIETKLGDVATARSSLERARSANPRSPLFQVG